jgi:hypothetical protein
MEHPLRKALNKFMAKFPDNPKGWSEATGELPSIHSHMAENFDGYNKHEGYSKNPEECNRRHKDGINFLYPKMSYDQKQATYNYFREWFE